MFQRLPLLIRISLSVLVIAVLIGLAESKTTDVPSQTSTGFYTKKLSNGTIITVHDPKQTTTTHTPTKTPLLNDIGGFLNSVFGKATSSKKEESTKYVTKTSVTHHTGTTTIKKSHSTTTKHHTTTTLKKAKSTKSNAPKEVVKKTKTLNNSKSSTKKSSSKATKTSHAKTTTSVDLVKTLTWINGTLTITNVPKPTPKPKKVLTISDGKLTLVIKPTTTITTKTETTTTTKKSKKTSTLTKEPKIDTTTTAAKETLTTSKPHMVLTMINGTLTFAPKTTTTTTTTTTTKTAKEHGIKTITPTTTTATTTITEDPIQSLTIIEGTLAPTETETATTTKTKKPQESLTIINGTLTFVTKTATATTASTTHIPAKAGTISLNDTTTVYGNHTVTTRIIPGSTTYINGTLTFIPKTTTTTVTEEPTTATTVTKDSTTITTTTTTTTTEESTTTTTTEEPTSTTTTTTTTFEATSTYRYQNYTWLADSFTYNPTTTVRPTSTTLDQSSSSTASATTTATTTVGTTSGGSGTNSVPEYIAPNVNAIIPDTSSMVHMKFNTLSYTDMVDNAILTAQFVQNLPVIISNSLDISVDDIIVVAIKNAATNTQSQNKKRDGAANGVIVTMAIPSTEVSDLQTLVSQANSTLYSPSNGQLATFIDSTYAISNNAASQSGSQTVNDPNSDSNSDNNSGGSGGGLSKGALIGICVSVGVIVYAAATMGVVHVYRKRRQLKQQQAIEQHQVFTQSISSPIMHENSLGWDNGYMVQPQQQQQNPYYHPSQW